MRLVWESYFTQRTDPSKNIVIQRMQVSCCGFFQPLRCIPNADPFPSDRLQTRISPELIASRVTCGEYPNFYPVQNNCEQFFDFSRGMLNSVLMCNILPVFLILVFSEISFLRRYYWWL